MVATSIKSDVFVEVYPVIAKNLPKLVAWKLNAPASQLAALGQKLAHRLRLRQKSHWVWGQKCLVTDSSIKEMEFSEFLKDLWLNDDEIFKLIRSVQEDVGFSPDIQTLADFVAFGVASDLDKPIREILRANRSTIHNAIVERDYEIKGLDVEGEPAISVSILSHIIPSISLSKYIATKVENSDDLVGMLVRDKTSSLRGKVTEIVGTVGELRDILVTKSSREQMKKLIQETADNELVLHIKSGQQNGYDYVASALNIVATSSQYEQLGIDGQEALSALQIQPEPRYQMVSSIVNLFARLGYITNQPFSSTTSPEHFKINLDNQLSIKALLGDNTTCECSPLSVLKALQRHPVYRQSSQLNNGASLKIGILNMIGGDESIRQYIADIRKNLFSIHFPVEFVGAERPISRTHHQIELSVEKLAQKDPHLVLAFVPGDPSDGEMHSNLYLQMKSIMLAHDIQSQVIYERTVGNQYALNNLILGILAKSGNVPYILEKSLPYTDLLVGIDIARDKNLRSRGSLNIAAMTRVYASNGDFLKYHIVDVPVEGETLTLPIIRKLFPASEFANKRCVVHRDGYFRGHEKDYLKEWGEEIGAIFYPIEVVKSHVPRLYKQELGHIMRTGKGSAFILNSTRAFLVSSLPPSKNSTPRPLMICTDGTITIEEALHSVLVLTHLHFGSIAMPRLPVTLHYSDQIGYLILKGVRPNNREGTLPFWI